MAVEVYRSFTGFLFAGSQGVWGMSEWNDVCLAIAGLHANREVCCSSPLLVHLMLFLVALCCVEENRCCSSTHTAHTAWKAVWKLFVLQQ